MRTQERQVDAPIFVIGCGRSGTTLLYEILAAHRSLAWFSNYTNRWPRLPALAGFSRVYPYARQHRLAFKTVPEPSEGHGVWDWVHPVTPGTGDGILTANDATSADARRAHSVIASHVHHQGAERFLNKNTRNTRRMSYLKTLFPDALFIHVIRDPRAVVASLLKVHFWNDLEIWWRDGDTTASLIRGGERPEELAAMLWVQETKAAIESETEMTDSVMHVKYEQITESLGSELKQVLDFTRLEWTTNFGSFVQHVRLSPNLTGYKAQFDQDELQRIRRIVGPLSARLGYSM